MTTQIRRSWTAPATREATEAEYVALADRIAEALAVIAREAGIPATVNALDQIADVAANALTRYGVTTL